MTNNRKDRFQVGDVVIKVSLGERIDGGGDGGKMGDSVVVIICDGDGMPKTSSESFYSHIDDRCWEVEAIANSPLYKALK